MSDSITASLHDWAKREPKRAALALGEKTWTFAELEERVLRAAGGLRALGAAGKHIAVLDKNHPATVELTYAAADSGSTCAILNWRLASEEVVYALKDSQARVLFIGAELLPILEKLKGAVDLARVVVFDAEQDGYEAWLHASAPLAAPVVAAPDDWFLLLYTSGTTGFPKGAMLTHRSVGAHSRNMVDLFSLDAASVSLVPMPLFHVGGICFAILCLFCGAFTVITRDTTPGPLLATFAKHRVTHTFIVPTLLHAFTQLPDLRALDSLEVCIYGGSPIPLPTLQKCLAMMKSRFFQVYGMTEMSGAFCALDDLAHHDPKHPERLVSAGRVAKGTTLRVVDPATGKDVGPGVLGEFWLKGEQMTKGYWNKPDATKESITADGWLRTGDAGTVDDAGFVFVQDRVKDMIITGGENVYPAEIERVLVQHSAVSECAVFGTPHEKWGETVRAAVVLKAGQTATAEALIAHCKAQLAGFKCPTAVDFLQALPRTATGKLLKRTLREPFWAGRTRQV
jgi:acyl-CoA synthetase (AMP-forming)/AMP-acid ligase II